MLIRQLSVQMVSIYMLAILEMTKSIHFIITRTRAQPLEADTNRDVTFTHGSGPRHMVFSPNGKHAYVTAEMRSEIVTFNVQDGHLKKVAELKLIHEDKTPEFKSASGIILSPNGKYVIAANRGADNKLLVFKNPTEWIAS